MKDLSRRQRLKGSIEVVVSELPLPLRRPPPRHLRSNRFTRLNIPPLCRSNRSHQRRLYARRRVRWSLARIEGMGCRTCWEWEENHDRGLKERERKGADEFGSASVSFGTQPPSHEPTSASTSSPFWRIMGSTRLMPALLPQTKTYPLNNPSYVPHIYNDLSVLLILYLLLTYHAQQANKQHVYWRFYMFYNDITVHHQYLTNSSDPRAKAHHFTPLYYQNVSFQLVFVLWSSYSYLGWFRMGCA